MTHWLEEAEPWGDSPRKYSNIARGDLTVSFGYDESASSPCIKFKVGSSIGGKYAAVEPAKNRVRHRNSIVSNQLLISTHCLMAEFAPE